MLKHLQHYFYQSVSLRERLLQGKKKHRFIEVQLFNASKAILTVQ